MFKDKSKRGPGPSPGPWVVQEGPVHCQIIPEGADARSTIATVKYTPEGEVHPDAYKLAAAYELLEAAQVALYALEDLKAPSSILQQLRGAIDSAQPLERRETT